MESIEALPVSCDIPSCTLSAMVMLNIQGMDPSPSSKSSWKIPYLQQLVDDSPEFIPFLSISETWLKGYMSDAQMTIKNYNIFRCDRKSRIRGGVALYIHNSITVDDFFHFDNKYCEAGVAHLKSSKTILAVFYRPQKCSLSDFTEALHFVEEKMSNYDESYSFVITGDFNFPNICWESTTVSHDCSKVTSDSALHLLKFMEKFLLNQVIEIPTRINNILDVLLTNKHDLVLDVTSVKSLISDHNVIKIPLAYSFGHQCAKTNQINSHPNNEKSFKCLDFSKADYNLIASALNKVDWDEIKSECSPDDFR